MNEDTLNLSIRKFLKTVGVTSQREIEQAVAKAITDRGIEGNETFKATMTLSVPDLGIESSFQGEIKLD